MSFRVKTTHPLLNPQQQPEKTASVSYLFSDDKNGEDLYLSNDYLKKSEQQNNRPTQSSSQGLAIRTVPTAQADHM